MTDTPVKLGSYNDFRAEHPEADVVEYTKELKALRLRIASMAGISVDALHSTHVPNRTTEGSQAE